MSLALQQLTSRRSITLSNKAGGRPRAGGRETSNAAPGAGAGAIKEREEKPDKIARAGQPEMRVGRKVLRVSRLTTFVTIVQ